MTGDDAGRESPREKWLSILLKGFCMGAADVVPGVSGGTMAFILGIYRRLLEAIRAFNLDLVKILAGRDFRRALAHCDFAFLCVLGAGIFGALLFFTRIVSLPGLLHSHPELVYGLFFGLIFGSIVVLIRRLPPWRATDAIWIAVGATAGLGVFNQVPVSTPDSAWFIFLCGVVAICAMILPGISGSFILLIMRKYAYVFDAIGHFKLSVIIPFGLGAGLGLMAFARVLVWMLNRFERPTMLLINGILVASLWVIWPFQARQFEVIRGKTRLIQSDPIWPIGSSSSSTEVLPALGLAVTGFVLVLLIDALAARQRRPLID